jgi:anti-sigma factor RsiW
MASDTWGERLEAYLDGELDNEAAAAFEAETAASASLQAELESRRRFRALARGVLLDETAPAPLIGSPRTVRGVHGRAARRVWGATAVAAVLGLLLLAPTLARRNAPTSPPRLPDIRAGQVVAIRFGEIPNATVTIETGCYDQTTDTVR